MLKCSSKFRASPVLKNGHVWAVSWLRTLRSQVGMASVPATDVTLGVWVSAPGTSSRRRGTSFSLHKGSVHLSSLFLIVVKRKEKGGGGGGGGGGARRRRQKRKKWRKQNVLREEKVEENYYKDRKKETKDAEEFLQMSELRRSLASSSPQLAKFSLKGQIVIITFLFWGSDGL